MLKSSEKSAEISNVERVSWEATSWGCVQYINYYARLRDGEKAAEMIWTVFANIVAPNLFAYMYPIRPGYFITWELDGNTGIAAGISEMLLQSHDGVVHLLPALPEDWRDGAIKGMCARGGFEVDMEWSSGDLKSAVVRTKFPQQCVVRYSDVKIQFAAAAGCEYVLDGRLNPFHTGDAQEGLL